MGSGSVAVRRVADNDTVDARVPDCLADTGELLVRVLVGADLDHDVGLRLALNLLGGAHDGCQDCSERGRSLEVAQAGVLGLETFTTTMSA